MKAEFLRLLEEFDSMDIEKTPSLITRIAIRDALVEKFEAYTAEERAFCNRIATTIKVDVNAAFVEDTAFFETCITRLVSITYKMHEAAVKHFGKDGFFNLMKHQSFGLTYDA